MKGFNWALAVPIVATFTSLFTAIFTILRNRRSDTILLYSSFVDDLHDEVGRLREQFDADRQRWAEKEKELLERIARLRREMRNLQDKVQQARIELMAHGQMPGKISPETQIIISELSKQLQSEALEEGDDDDAG